MRSLDIAGTGMQAQQTNVEVISNNIANMTTTGFKRRRAEFQDLIYQNLRTVGSNSSDTGTIVPSGAQVGLGVKTAGGRFRRRRTIRSRHHCIAVRPVPRRSILVVVAVRRNLGADVTHPVKIVDPIVSMPI